MDQAEMQQTELLIQMSGQRQKVLAEIKKHLATIYSIEREILDDVRTLHGADVVIDETVKISPMPKARHIVWSAHTIDYRLYDASNHSEDIRHYFKDVAVLFISQTWARKSVCMTNIATNEFKYKYQQKLQDLTAEIITYINDNIVSKHPYKDKVTAYIFKGKGGLRSSVLSIHMGWFPSCFLFSSTSIPPFPIVDES